MQIKHSFEFKDNRKKDRNSQLKKEKNSIPDIYQAKLEVETT